MTTREPETLLEVRGASFAYRGQRSGPPVLAGVDVRIRAGDFFGIVGPNGGGKTTLFRGMLGLLEPKAGSVVRHADAVGYVPQREALDPVYPLSVRETVEMGAYARSRNRWRVSPEDRARARELLGEVELADREHAEFASLSGGQRQRVLIARSLMTAPRMLLLDEPTSGVDEHAVTLVMELLARLNAKGIAVLIVSHQLPVLRESVRRVLRVGGGEVREGTPEELLGDVLPGGAV